MDIDLRLDESVLVLDDFSEKINLVADLFAAAGSTCAGAAVSARCLAASHGCAASESGVMLLVNEAG